MTRVFIRAWILFCLPVALPVGAQSINIFEDDEARERLVQLEERMDQVEGNLRALAKESAALTAEKQELLDRLRELSNLAEEANLTASTQDNRINKLDGDLKQEITASEKRVTDEVKRLAANLTHDANKLYARALRANEDGNIRNAERNMRELLRRFPDSSYVAAARYWISRLAIDDANFDLARDELTVLQNTHPNHPRAPDALALLAELAAARGDAIAAKHWQSKLLELHPTSAAADRLRLGKASLPQLGNNI